MTGLCFAVFVCFPFHTDTDRRVVRLYFIRSIYRNITPIHFKGISVCFVFFFSQKWKFNLPTTRPSLFLIVIIIVLLLFCYCIIYTPIFGWTNKNKNETTAVIRAIFICGGLRRLRLLLLLCLAHLCLAAFMRLHHTLRTVQCGNKMRPNEIRRCRVSCCVRSADREENNKHCQQWIQINKHFRKQEQISTIDWIANELSGWACCAIECQMYLCLCI